MENQLKALIKKQDLMKKVKSAIQAKDIEKSKINSDLKKLQSALANLVDTDAEESQNLFSEFEDLDNYLAKDLK